MSTSFLWMAQPILRTLLQPTEDVRMLVWIHRRAAVFPRRFLAVCSLPLAVGLLLLTGVSSSCGGGRSPNIILITVDSLRADHLSSLGYPRETTPILDSLVANGFLFPRGYSQSTSTAAAHASILTGQSPRTHRVLKDGDSLPENTESLALALRNRGYRTLAIVSESSLESSKGFDVGFDLYEQGFPFADKERGVHSKDADFTTRTVLKELQLSNTQPFFLWVHYNDPGSPYAAPEPHSSRFRADDHVDHEHDVFDDRATQVPRGISQLGETNPSLLIADYDAEIRSVDEQIGFLLEGLEKLGLRERTTLVVTSSHGENLDDQNPIFQHGQGVSEAQVRVPILFYDPARIPAGKSSDHPIAQTDLLPTLLALSGGVSLPNLEGRNLVPLMEGDAVSGDERTIYSFASGAEGCCVIRGNFKLTVDATGEEKKLFQVVEDPQEREDLFSPEHPEVGPLSQKLPDLLRSE